jgi:hypothetical protein
MSLTELVAIAIGCMLMALGFASVVAWPLRRRAAERLLLLFGIASFQPWPSRLLQRGVVEPAGEWPDPAGPQRLNGAGPTAAVGPGGEHACDEHGIPF